MTTGDDVDSREYPCLVRVTDGKEHNLSTRVCLLFAHCAILFWYDPTHKVEPGELEKFHATYGTLLKTSMATLRKRDKKREKQRAEAGIRRKRRLAEQIAVVGPKRGNGRRKRQRQMKRAIKLEETKRKVEEKEEAKAKAKSA